MCFSGSTRKGFKKQMRLNGFLWMLWARGLEFCKFEGSLLFVEVLKYSKIFTKMVSSLEWKFFCFVNQRKHERPPQTH